MYRITDFGASRNALVDSNTMTMTSGVGSPFYMAPEMLRGDQKYTRTVDVYSFSILCVELWNEKLPFSEVRFDTPFAFIQYVIRGHRPAIRDDCPRQLAKLLAHCWSEDRVNRPPFTDVVKDLTPIVEHIHKHAPSDVEDVVARQPPPGRTPTKGKTGNRKSKKATSKTSKKNKTHRSTEKIPDSPVTDSASKDKHHKSHKRVTKSSDTDDIQLDDL